MKELTLDLKNYKDGGTIFKRTAVRGIIKRDGKYLFIKSKYGDHKFPGGGQEKGESLKQTLIREVKEETGFDIIKGSIKDGYLVHEKRKGDKEDILVMDSYYFFCEVGEIQGDTNLDDYEKEYGYKVVWEDIIDVYSANMCINDYKLMPWAGRETAVLKEIISG